MLPVGDSQRIELLPNFGETLIGLGDFAGARSALNEAIVAAERLNMPRLRASAQVIALYIRLHGGEADETGEDPLTVVQSLVPLLEREQAHLELAVAWRLIVLIHGIAGRYRSASDAAVHSIEFARRAGNARIVAKVGGILSHTALLGTTPVPQAIEQCEQLIQDGLSDQLVEGNTLCVLAQLRAMSGDFVEARSLVHRGRAKMRDLERGVTAATSGIALAHVELLGGDLSTAEPLIRADYEFLTSIGETFNRSTMAAMLARVVRELGRHEEALELSRIAEAATSADDIDSQVLWRVVRAPILAHAGHLEEAEALAQLAVDLAFQTEAIDLQAEALAELAVVLNAAGKVEEAGLRIAEAIQLYGQKGNLVATKRAHAFQAALLAT